MPGARITKEIVNGHMTHTRNRREKPTATRKGRTYVEVLIWRGPEAVGRPLGEWEMPPVYMYDHLAAARLAVSQQRFPKPATVPVATGFLPAPEVEDDHETDFVIVRRRRDGLRQRLSGRDSAQKLSKLAEALRTRTHLGALVWLHVHLEDHDSRVTRTSATMPMVFTVGNILELLRTRVTRAVDELLDHPPEVQDEQDQ